MALERLDDELDVLTGYTFNRLLDYVVAVLVFDAFEDVTVEFADESGLLFREDVFKCLETR